MDKEEFVEEVRRRFIYSMDRDITDLISVVLMALQKLVSKGELEDILSILPKDLSLMLKRLEEI